MGRVEILKEAPAKKNRGAGGIHARHDGAGRQTVMDSGRALPGRRDEGERLKLAFDDTPHTVIYNLTHHTTAVSVLRRRISLSCGRS